VGQVVLFALTAALNPTLLAATTVMLLLPDAVGLLLGYWLVAMLVSVALGLLIVFSFESSTTVGTTKNTVSPVADLVLGGLAHVVAFVVGTGRDKAITERRAEKHKDWDPPRWQRTIAKGSARMTFVVGVALTLPGASYLLGLHQIDQLQYSNAATVLLVVGFNLVMLILLEVPLVAFALAPQRAPQAIERAKASISRHGRTFAVRFLSVIGGLLILKGTIGLV
jgi:Sap, sulfolipid-1-addressing protein